MRPFDEDALNRWLAAERDDRSDEAEAALLELFEGLPLLAPPAGFADRVLLRAGIVPVVTAAPARPALFARLWVRMAVALCLLATALSWLWLPQTLRALAGTWHWSLGGLFEAGTHLLIEMSLGMATAIRFGDWFFSVGEALARPLLDPEVSAVLAGCLLVSILAFRALRDLMTRERSFYVDPV